MRLEWAAVALFAVPGSVQAQTTLRASISSTGAQADQGAIPVYAISTDGRFVAYASAATTLVPGDTNATEDVFVRDRLTATTERVSVDSAGAQANGSSVWPALSDDGRYVAFASSASNLVPGDTNGQQDVFVRDRLSGTTTRVSVDSAGAEGNHLSRSPTISSDGRFVAFHSSASNLVAGDTNGLPDCFVHDRQSGTTERLSLDPSGGEGNGMSQDAQISFDGRFVVYASYASNLVAGDGNGFWDVFVRDRQTGTTERISVGTGGVEGNWHTGSWYASLSTRTVSSDGRYVAFCSHATNFTANDGNGNHADIFVRDRLGGTTEVVSVDSNGLQGFGESLSPSISADGRYVAFQSEVPYLVPEDSNWWMDVFVHDRLSGTTELASRSWLGAPGWLQSDMPVISPDARFVVFGSTAPNLVVGDTNGLNDVFVRVRGDPGVLSVCTPGDAATRNCPCANPPVGANRGCNNSSATGGGALSASGGTSLTVDTLLFHTAGETPTATSVVVQGTAPVFGGVVFGQGVRCVGGTLKRLYVKTASGGSILAPSGSDLSVSARSAALGDVIAAGEHRFYFVQYRDPFVLGGCPAASTFNATNAVDVPWSP